MPTVPTTVPVRHGYCRLTLRIGLTEYYLRPVTTPPPGMKVWILRSLNGPRAGVCYSVASGHQSVGCTCPDHESNGAKCKHIMALRALHLIPKGRARERSKPETHRPNRRKALRLHSAAVADLAQAEAVPVAAADAAGFAQGFNEAVRTHVAALAGSAR